MQFTTVRSKKKDYDIYLKSEKLVLSNQEHKKNVSQLFGSGKNWFLAISSLTNTVSSIWREKKVDPCYLETKKFNSQLFGLQQLEARKECFPAIWKCKKQIPSYVASNKHCCRYLEREKSGSLLFGDQKI